MTEHPVPRTPAAAAHEAARTARSVDSAAAVSPRRAQRAAAMFARPHEQTPGSDGAAQATSACCEPESTQQTTKVQDRISGKTLT